MREEAPPTTRTLRQFALLWTALLPALGAWQGLLRGRAAVGWSLLGLGLCLGPLGVLRPRLMRPLFVGWLRLTFPLRWAVTHALLALLFYGLFAPLGLLFRLLRRDALALRRGNGHDSYWAERRAPRDPRSYFRQS